MRRTLSLLAVVAAATGAKLPTVPSGLYETPTVEFGGAPSLLNEVSQEPIAPVGTQSELLLGAAEGSCCGPLLQPVSIGTPFTNSQSGPSSQQSSQLISSQSFFNQPEPQFVQSFSSQSGPSLISQAGSSSVHQVPVTPVKQSQSNYYGSSSSGTHSTGSIIKRPSNVFLDNPGMFDSQQFTQTFVNRPAQSSYDSNVFLGSQSNPSSGSFIRQETVGPVPFGPQGSGSVPGGRVTQVTSLSSGYIPPSRVTQPVLQTGSGSGPVGQQLIPNRAPTVSQSSYSPPPQLPASPSTQLLNRHPGGGGSGPLGHFRTCSTSMVCVPLAMCNPYTGFVRGGLLYEPEEPTLQPTVALDRCTKLKDGGTGDGVCCQMPHINDPWPRDQ